jgi:AcrR family transcriptional regulator
MSAMTVTTTADPDKRSPGRPRSAKAEQAIIEAVLDLLGEGVAIDALSIEAVAARAGVGKATIYRRWPSKEDLILDAVSALKFPLPTLAGENVRDDLVALLRATGLDGGTGRRRAFTCVIPQVQRNPELHHWYQKLVERRRGVLRDVVRRGMATGELRPDLDVEVILSMLVAPMIMQNMINWNPALNTEDLPERIVAAALAGAAPDPGGARP